MCSFKTSFFRIVLLLCIDMLPVFDHFEANDNQCGCRIFAFVLTRFYWLSLYSFAKSIVDLGL